MDPTENLRMQLRIADRLIEADDKDLRPLPTDAVALAELVIALDEWVKAGGFLPSQWLEARGMKAPK